MLGKSGTTETKGEAVRETTEGAAGE
jgi:hypothetical protein